MIAKSGYRLSEKIVLKQEAGAQVFAGKCYGKRDPS
jgi:hypothetical protein